MPPPVKRLRQSFLAQPIQQDQLATIITDSLRNASLGSESESHSKKRACVKCCATSNKEGGRLHQCSCCHIVNYCSKECQVDVSICLVPNTIYSCFQHNADKDSFFFASIGFEKPQRVLQDHQE